MKTRSKSRMSLILGLTTLLAASQGCGGDLHNQSNKLPVIEQSIQSECLNKTRLPDGNVEVQVSGDSILIVDHHAEFNCCLDVWMQASVNGDEIVVVEVEDPNHQNACDCTCPFELSIGISNLADGEYTVRVYRQAEDPQTLIHRETVCLGSCQEECQTEVDCLEHTWGIYCQGHWACSAGVCEEVCDMETCGDGTCDALGGENLQSCRVDCKTQPNVTLASFEAACADCGAEECYQPGAPFGESRFEYVVEADPDHPGQYLIRAVHQVLCIDVAILGAELEGQGSDLVLTETFDYDNPVDCYCNYRADILIAGLMPGAYLLKIYDNNHISLLVDQSVVVAP